MCLKKALYLLLDSNFKNKYKFKLNQFENLIDKITERSFVIKAQKKQRQKSRSFQTFQLYYRTAVITYFL